jgi:hypothetical protein
MCSEHIFAQTDVLAYVTVAMYGCVGTIFLVRSSHSGVFQYFEGHSTVMVVLLIRLYKTG